MKQSLRRLLRCLTLGPARGAWPRSFIAGLLGVVLMASACSTSEVQTAPTPTEAVTTSDAAPEPAPTTSGSSRADSTTTPAWPHDWTEELVGGGQIDAGDYRGQDLVLWFWAPW